ncbi:S-adenosyl-L-methionine-dependentmethyltransferases superfamily protein [Striga asiatica]|uniref:S-adenosyl-L-methionine-dependentmethyltransferases superfamily protein n=1 Tax=Striga asiatica TaxID=4170 RepID=A0A5A7QTG7_STRAF|nr:S-adenosyl-L-methionine-dependentmethyltransferases superfamily protein [Striga asiatica]
MEKHVQILLNRLSFASIAIATLTLFLLYLQTPDNCVDPSDPNPKPHTRFPKSTCDLTHRRYTSVDKRNRRLWSTNAWKSAVASYSSLLTALQARNHFSNDSRALVVSAGPGHAVRALQELGVEEVTGVELVGSPPLVTRADPHNLPFFDGVFDLGLGLYLDRALFPGRFVGQMERTVRSGGVCFDCRRVWGE